MSPDDALHHALFRLSIDVCPHLSGQAMFDGDFPLVNLVFNKNILHLNVFSALQAVALLFILSSIVLMLS